MRALLLVCALAATAHADPKRDVTHDVQEILDHGFMGVKVHGPSGAVLEGAQANELTFGKTVKLGKVTVGVVAEKPTLAWFQAPITFDGAAYRISGIDLGDDIDEVTLSKVVSDADLIAAAKKAARPMPAKPLEGDDTTGRAAYWVSHGFAPPAAVGWPDVVAASGTAPSEYAVGQAAVKKLVAGWDKLKLVPVSGSTDEDSYSLHVVHLEVMMPIKGTKLGVPMLLTAIVRSDGTYWQWQSLQFSPVL